MSNPLFGQRFDRQSQYRDRLASQLLAQGSDASPVQHWTQGAARLAQALAGGMIGMKQDQRYAEREKQSSEAMANLFAPSQQFVPSAAGAGPRPGAQMQTAQPTLAEMAQRAAAHPATQHLAPQFQMQDMAAQREAANRVTYKPGEQNGLKGQIGSDGKFIPDPLPRNGGAPSMVQEYEFAKTQGFPGSFMEYQQRRSEAGRPQTNVNVATGSSGPQIGSIPPGHALHTNPDGSLELRPIAGGPAAREVAKADDATAEGVQQRAAGADIVSQDITRALGLMDSAVLPTSGMLGQATSKIGGTAASDISSLLDTVKANTAFDKLAEMRKASPTGAALGSVTERELNLLASVRGSLEQSQSPEQLRRNLTRLNNTMLDIVHGPGQGPARIEGPKAPNAGPRSGTGAQRAVAPAPNIDALLEKYAR